MLSPLLQFLQSQGLRSGIDFKLKTYHKANTTVIQLRECPLCPKPHRNEPTNLWVFGLFANDGGFNCFRCEHHGDWHALRRLFNLHGFEQGAAAETEWPFDGDHCDGDEDGGSEIVRIERSGEIADSEVDLLNERLLAEKPLLHRLCRERRVSTKCFMDYKVGLQYRWIGAVPQKQQVIAFPMYRLKEGRVVATKWKTRSVSNGLKRFGQFPAMNEVGVFGLNLRAQRSESGNGSGTVVVTEGEFDSMAIYEGTEYAVTPISVPHGANGLPHRILSQLTDSADRFVLFFDWDGAGRSGAEKLKRQIQGQAQRVTVDIVPQREDLRNAKDANDVLIEFGPEKGAQIMHEIMAPYL